MSQDGSWQERVQELEQRVELEQRNAERAEWIVAALVRKYGEPVHGNGYRVALTEAEQEDSLGTLSVNLDPCSGAILLRFRPE